LLECFNSDDLFITLSEAVASELSASILQEMPKPSKMPSVNPDEALRRKV